MNKATIYGEPVNLTHKELHDIGLSLETISLIIRLARLSAQEVIDFAIASKINFKNITQSEANAHLAAYLQSIGRWNFMVNKGE